MATVLPNSAKLTVGQPQGAYYTVSINCSSYGDSADTNGGRISPVSAWDFTTPPTQGLIKNMPLPLNLNENQMSDPGKYTWTNNQYLNFFLSNDEKKLHQSAVYHTLNNVPNNEVSTWYSKTNNSNGMVRVFHSFQTSTGYCRVYQTLIEVNNLSKHQTNKACKVD